MSCRPEEVTAFVDGELSGAARDRMVAHLTSPCPRCVVQAEEERAVRRWLRPVGGGLRALAAEASIGHLVAPQPT